MSGHEAGCQRQGNFCPDCGYRACLLRSDLEGVAPAKVHNGGFSTDATDPEMVQALARRLIRPLRERAKDLGDALAIHGSLARDIDLIAVPWTERAHPPASLANGLKQVLEKLYPIGLEVGPSDEPAKRKPHGRLCWSWWVRSWTYIDLSVYPPADSGA